MYSCKIINWAKTKYTLSDKHLKNFLTYNSAISSKKFNVNKVINLFWLFLYILNKELKSTLKKMPLQFVHQITLNK